MTERDEQHGDWQDGPTLEASLLAVAPDEPEPDSSGNDFGLEFEDGETGGGDDRAPSTNDERASSLTRTGAASLTSPFTEPSTGPALSASDLAWALGWPGDRSPWGDAGNAAADATTRNRRGEARHPVHSRATVRRAAAKAGGNATETVRLRNLSAGGVSVLHDSAMRPGDTFWITLRNPDDRATPGVARAIDRRCTVLRCEPGGAGRALFNVAARFVT